MNSNSATLAAARQGDRGARTKQRLLATALDLFGRHGFDGVSTRQLAERARVNQAAIAYHFGSKEGLYRAVAQHIANEVTGRSTPLVAALEARLAQTADRREAGRLLRELVRGMAAILVGSPEAAQWARFILREQMEPSPAFDIFYEAIAAGPLRTLMRLVARVSGEEEETEEVRLRAFALMGQVLAFRMARAAVLRRLGWSAIGRRELAAIQTVIDANIEAIVEALVQR